MTKEKLIGTIELDGRKVQVRVAVRLERKGEQKWALGISGELRYPGARDCFTCGQIQDTLKTAKWIDGPTVDIAKLLAYWDAWHLNNMKPGCEHQRAECWDQRPIDPAKPLNAYGRFFPGQCSDSWNMLAWVRPDEHPEGLLTKPCPVCGYKYGTAWLHEDLPEEVVTWAQAW